MNRTDNTGTRRRVNRPTATVAAKPDNAIARFLRSARLCRTRDLQQLSILGALVRELSRLIHALQKERGAASIFLGSHGRQFAQQLAQRVAESRALERTVRERLEHVDEQLDRMGSGARFYTRVALALRALDTLPELRAEIISQAVAPQDSVQAFTVVIGHLLAVGFEVGDIAADPVISRALVALVNFAQAKEYAGQERATVGGALSSGTLSGADRERMQQLISAQDEALRVFTEFSDSAHSEAFTAAATGSDAVEVIRMRQSVGHSAPGEPLGVSADAWYRHTTGRIDALHAIEDAMSHELGNLCSSKLAEAHSDAGGAATTQIDDILATASFAVLLSDAAGIGLYTLENSGPRPMRSILHVIQAQSRRIDDVSAQLESARAALVERKIIDRAKGLLMSSRNLSEQDAYALMRDTAMRQNKRLVDIADTVVSMAEFLQS